MMTRSNQTIFYLESIDFDWLPSRTRLWQTRWGVIFVSAMLFGLSGALIFGLSGRLIDGLGIGLTGGLIFGLITVSVKARPVEWARFRWAPAPRASTERRDRLKFEPSFGLIIGLFVLVIVGLIRLFTREATPETRCTINEGTYRSIRIALITWVIVGLILGLIVGLSGGRGVGLRNWLNDGLLIALVSALIVGPSAGGAFALKHFVLRLFLWKGGSAPLRYVTFLDQAKALLFLRQVGGGYIFTHRLLQEYFASLASSKKATATQPSRNTPGSL